MGQPEVYSFYTNIRWTAVHRLQQDYVPPLSIFLITLRPKIGATLVVFPKSVQMYGLGFSHRDNAIIMVFPQDEDDYYCEHAQYFRMHILHSLHYSIPAACRCRVVRFENVLVINYYAFLLR